MSSLANNYRIYQAAVTNVVTALVSPTGNAVDFALPTVMPVKLVEGACRQGMSIRNIGLIPVWLVTDPTQTVASGYPIMPNEAVAVDVRDGRQVYLATAAGVSTVAVWEV